MVNILIDITGFFPYKNYGAQTFILNFFRELDSKNDSSIIIICSKKTLEFLKFENLKIRAFFIPENLLLEEYSRSEKYFLDLLVTNYNFDPNSKSDIEILYNQSYNFAGLWRMVFVWADRDFEETIEEMSDMLSKIATKHA